MANQISGVIIALGERRIFQKKDGSQGWNQEVVLDASRYSQQTGEKYENYPSVDINDRLQAQLEVGMRVRFDIDVQGRYYQDKQTGAQKHITTVNGYRCEVLGQARAQAQPSTAVGQMQAGVPSMAQGYQQAPQGYQPQQDSMPFPPTSNPPF